MHKLGTGKTTSAEEVRMNAKGEHFVYCADGECGKFNCWKTCLPCGLDDTTYATQDCCKKCLPAQKQHRVDSRDSSRCIECTSCEDARP